MTFYRKALGQSGETQAVQYLQAAGFHIIERNFRTRIGEIDIIAKRGDKLHFIEVKTRKDAKKGLPYEAVTPRKLKHLQLTIAVYLKKMHIREMKYSLDIVSILLDTGVIKHYIGIDVRGDYN